MKSFLISLTTILFCSISLLAQLESYSQPPYLMPYTLQVIVTSSADSGPGSLREAVGRINSGVGNRISFSTTGSSMYITLYSPLPAISRVCMIDGSVNLDYNGQVQAGKMTGAVIISAGNASVAQAPPIEFLAQGSYCWIPQMSFTGFQARTYTVTNTNAFGAGSFQWASSCAQMAYNLGLDTIKFNIPGNGPHTVSNGGVSSPFYASDIFSPMVIDGRTQTGYAPDVPSIKFSGTHLSYSEWGLRIRATNVQVYGIQFENFSSGIEMAGYGTLNKNANQALVEGCTFGNNSKGVELTYSTSYNYSCTNIRIQNCYVGCDAQGNAMPNVTGISVSGTDIEILNNVISGNTGAGLQTTNLSLFSELSNCTVRGNKMGVSPIGMTALPNNVGIDFRNSLNTIIEGNQISGNTNEAIRVYTMGYSSGSTFPSIHTIRNNKIGTDTSGTGSIPNKYGIYNRGSGYKFLIENNIIANNTEYAVNSTNGAVIRGNSVFNNMAFAQFTPPSGPVFTLRSASELRGTYAANRKVQLFYNHQANSTAQGKIFIAEVLADTSGNWAYTGIIADHCDVTALGYDSISYTSSAFVSTTNVDLIPAQSTSCTGDTALLQAPGSYSQYLWSTGDTTSSIRTDIAGKYWIQASNGCSYADTVDVAFVSKPSPSLGPDTNMCAGSYTLSAGSFSGATYYWNNSNFASMSSRTVTASGMYTVRVEIGNCKNSDTAQVFFHAKPTVKLSNDTLICNASSLLLDARNPGAHYSWSTGDTTQTITASAAGIYSVQCYFHTSCVRTDTINIQTTNCNVVSGTVYQDLNSNCVKELSEVPMSGRVVILTRNTDLVSYYTMTDASGAYSMNLPVGNYTIRTPDNGYPVFCPASGRYLVTVGSAVSTNRNFGVRFVPYHDVSIGLTAINPSVRLNTSFDYTLSYTNTGNQSESGFIRMPIDPFLEFVSSDHVYTVSNDTVSWAFTGLNPGEMQKIVLRLRVPLNQSLAGTSICHSANISIQNTDSHTANNTISNCIRFTYPYDPNCKLVSPAGVGPAGFISSADSSLVYTIHFQNTGTDTAYTVVIADTISALLNAASIESIGASAAYRFTLEGTGIAKWTFENIMLPDSNVNEEKSHGFIQFRIKTKQGLLPGDQIVNRAHIYFDLAAPVTTDAAVNTIKNDLEPQQIFVSQLSDQLYPSLYVKLNAVSDGALPLTYVISGPVTQKGDSLEFHGTGEVRVRLVQGGDENYSAAAPVDFTFNIVRGKPLLVLDSIADYFETANFVLLNASSDVQIPIFYEVISGPASMVGNQVNFTGTGEVIVRVRQDESAYYEAAEAVRTFSILMATSVVETSGIPELYMYPNPAFEHVTVTSIGETAVIIRNMQGALILEEVFTSPSQKISLEHFESGVYVVEISTAAGKTELKLVVQK